MTEPPTIQVYGDTGEWEVRIDVTNKTVEVRDEASWSEGARRFWEELRRIAAPEVVADPEPREQVVRAMLALAEELDGAPEWNPWPRDAAARIRTTVADVLAADPEPRDAVIERMARAMWDARVGTAPWDLISKLTKDEWRRFAAAALDASRGATQ